MSIKTKNKQKNKNNEAELLNEMTQLNAKATDMGKNGVKRDTKRMSVCACNAIHNNNLQWKRRNKKKQKTKKKKQQPAREENINHNCIRCFFSV